MNLFIFIVEVASCQSTCVNNAKIWIKSMNFGQDDKMSGIALKCLSVKMSNFKILNVTN